jgi:hypothetical protein
MSLPGMAKIEEIFLAKADSWLKLVRERDLEHFAQRMDYLRRQLKIEDPNFDAGYKNMYSTRG